MIIPNTTISYIPDADIPAFLVDIIAQYVPDRLCVGCTPNQDKTKFKIDFILRANPAKINTFEITKENDKLLLNIPEVNYD